VTIRAAGPSTLERLTEPLLLFKLDDRRIDGLLTLVVAAGLVLSRFALLASGPWEWDEVLFARGMLDFNLAAHFPHPPGFPGWLAIGHLLLPLAREPWVALQWASAALSVIVLWPLAALGRRVAPPQVAVLAALLILFAPGPWLYAMRGFSSTPAAVLAVAAAALAVTGVEGRRLTWFSVLMAAAWLVRPNLLPGLGLLWLGVAAGVRPLRRLLPGMAAGAAMVAAAIASMAIAEGGWRAFVAAFVSHANKHFSRLGDAPAGWSGLGLVKGLGGSFWAAGLISLALAGLWAWFRRGHRRTAVVWLVVIGVTAGQLVLLQNKTYTRYAVPLHLGMAPLIAGGAALAPPPLASAGLAAAAVALALKALPPVVEQHQTELPGWSAVQFAAREAGVRGASVVVEPELYPFASYVWHLLERDGVQPPPLVLSPWAPEPWAGVRTPYLVATIHRQLYPPPLAGDEVGWGGVSDRLRPLTQQRFLEAWVINNPPLPISGWWPVERLPSGGGFMWGGAECGLLVPPLPPGVGISLLLRPAPGEAPLEVLANGRTVAEIGGRDGRQTVVVPPERCVGTSTNRLGFSRSTGYPPGTSDARPLAVQLFGAALSGPGLEWGGPVVTASEREAIGLVLVGHHQPESFGPAGAGVWTTARSRLELAAAPGRLVITMSAPRLVPPKPTIRVNGVVVREGLELTSAPSEVVIPVEPSEADGGRVTVEILSVPYVPRAAGRGPDQRELGVVLHRVDFVPTYTLNWGEPFRTRHEDSHQSSVISHQSHP